MKKEILTYEQAVERLHEIVQGFESGEANLEQISTQLKEAKRLLKQCKEQLAKTENDIQDILNDGER